MKIQFKKLLKILFKNEFWCLWYWFLINLPISLVLIIIQPPTLIILLSNIFLLWGMINIFIITIMVEILK